MKAAFRNEEEDLAAAYLRERGFIVLARNDRRFGAEIDFLCAHTKNDEFFIFEVKKKPRAASMAYPRVSAKQLARLKKAAMQMQAVAGKFLPVSIALLVVDRTANVVEWIEMR